MTRKRTTKTRRKREQRITKRAIARASHLRQEPRKAPEPYQLATDHVTLRYALLEACGNCGHSVHHHVHNLPDETCAGSVYSNDNGNVECDCTRFTLSKAYLKQYAFCACGQHMSEHIGGNATCSNSAVAIRCDHEVRLLDLAKQRYRASRHKRTKSCPGNCKMPLCTCIWSQQDVMRGVRTTSIGELCTCGHPEVVHGAMNGCMHTSCECVRYVVANSNLKSDENAATEQKHEMPTVTQGEQKLEHVNVAMMMDEADRYRKELGEKVAYLNERHREEQDREQSYLMAQAVHQEHKEELARLVRPEEADEFVYACTRRACGIRIVVAKDDVNVDVQVRDARYYRSTHGVPVHRAWVVTLGDVNALMDDDARMQVYVSYRSSCT